MPYKFSQPVAVADIVEIEEIRIHPAGPSIDVLLRHGLRRADGSIQPGLLSQVNIIGARAAALAGAKPDGAKTLYANIKAMLYADLIAAGDLSGGTVV